MQGAYGEVNYPPIACEKAVNTQTKTEREIKRSNKYISKKMNVKDAEKQLNEVSVADKIDPSQSYHIGFPLKCEDADKNKDGQTVLYYSYGGPSLDRWLDTYNNIVKFVGNFMDFARSLRIFMNGIMIQNEQLFFHNDIKPANIVFNGQTTKLIDYGTSFSLENRNSATVSPLLMSSYIFYPPEYQQLISDGRFPERVKAKLRDHFGDGSSVNYVGFKYKEKDIEQIANSIRLSPINCVPIMSNGTLLYRITSDEGEVHDGAVADFFATSDSYALGITFLHMLFVIRNYTGKTNERIYEVAKKLAEPVPHKRMKLEEAYRILFQKAE